MTITLAPDGLKVADDGRGFLPDDRRQGEGGHFGIIGMRERARRIGADLQLLSQPGRGTTLTVCLPAPAKV